MQSVCLSPFSLILQTDVHIVTKVQNFHLFPCFKILPWFAQTWAWRPWASEPRREVTAGAVIRMRRRCQNVSSRRATENDGKRQKEHLRSLSVSLSLSLSPKVPKTNELHHRHENWTDGGTGCLRARDDLCLFYARPLIAVTIAANYTADRGFYAVRGFENHLVFHKTFPPTPYLSTF